MQNMFGSLLILSSVASLGHAARFSLLRIADDTNGSSNVNKATEFRSIFEEGLNGKFRDLLMNEGLLEFSLSMSMATKFPEEAPTPATPTSAPVTAPTTVITPPVNGTAPPTFNDTNTAAAAEENEQKGSVNLSSAKTSPTNIALIAIGSCAVVGMALLAAKRLQSSNAKYGTLSKGSSEVSSVKTSENVISTTNSLDSDLLQNIQL